MRILGLLLFIIPIIFAVGCITITVGKEFSRLHENDIITNTTTQQEILARYGKPFRTGLKNNNKTWTYLYYRLSDQDTYTMDLVITFDKEGKVIEFDYNNNFPDLTPPVNPKTAEDKTKKEIPQTLPSEKNDK